jgi:hypothetical protein
MGEGGRVGNRLGCTSMHHDMVDRHVCESHLGREGEWVRTYYGDGSGGKGAVLRKGRVTRAKK